MAAATWTVRKLHFMQDTFFSALFQEALKFGKEKEFLSRIEEGKLLFSDAFPYMGKCFYIPKPVIHIEPKADQEQGNSRKKKLFKNLKIYSTGKSGNLFQRRF